MNIEQLKEELSNGKPIKEVLEMKNITTKEKIELVGFYYRKFIDHRVLGPEEMPEETKLKVEEMRKSKKKNTRLVWCRYRNEVYPSLNYVSKKFKIPQSTLSSYLNGDQLNQTTLMYV
jgi:hypothetical protein